jgi:putative inorganic carbon (HCO3(-)) transporter
MDGAMVEQVTDLTRRLDRHPEYLLPAIALIGVAFGFNPPVPGAALLMVLAAAISCVCPAVGLASVLAATPFIFRPVEIDGRIFTHLELALLALAVGFGGRLVIDAFLARSIHGTIGLLHPWGPIIGAIVLAGLGAISIVTLADTEHRDASLRALRTVILEPLVIIPVARWTFRRGQSVVVLCGLAVMIVVTACWGVLQIATGSGIAADGVRRATGPYSHPNNLSFFLERATLLVGIPALLLPKWRRIGVVLVTVGAIGVLATLSRGALIGAPVAVAVALWLSGRLRAIAGVVVGAIAVGGAMALFAGNRLFDSGSEGSEPSRLVLWRASERMIRDFPLPGIGLDQFYVMYGLRYIQPSGWPERYTSHPHNIVLDFWLSLGIGGVLFLVIAIFWGIISMLRLRRRDDETPVRFLAIGGAAALVAGLVHGMVDNAFFLPDLAVLTWFSIVLLSEGLRLFGEERSQ